MRKRNLKYLDNISYMWSSSINKIRNKLLFVLLFVTLLPTLLIGGYALLFATDILRDSSLSIHSAKIELISEKILNYLEQVNSDLFYLRDSNALNLYLSSLESDSAQKKRLMLTNLRTSFKKFARQKRNYQQIRFINSEGLEVVGIDSVGDQVQNVSDIDLQDKKNTSYFQNAMALNKDGFFVTALNLSQVRGTIVKRNQPTINYATPVYDKTNALLGIVALNVDLKRIMNIIVSEAQAGTQIQFVNPDGFYYFYSDESKTPQDENSPNPKINVFSEKQKLRNLILSSSASGTFSSDNNIVTYKVIKINDNKFNLGVILDITPKNLVFEAEENFLYIFIGVIFIALILTFILAIVLSNSITQPLIALTNDVDRLSKGDLETRIVVESTDEIGKLATAIERLRKSMKILMKRAA